MKNQKIICAILTICIILATVVYSGTCSHFTCEAANNGDGPFYQHQYDGQMRGVYFDENGNIVSTHPISELADAESNCQ